MVYGKYLNEIIETVKKEGLRPSVVNYCPGCDKEFATEEDIRAIGTKASLGKSVIESAIELFKRKGAASVGIYVPKRTEMIEYLDRRFIIHPCCATCLKDTDGHSLEDNIEHKIRMSRSRSKIIKG